MKISIRFMKVIFGAVFFMHINLPLLSAQVRPTNYYHPTKLEEKEVTIDAYDMHQCHVANWMSKADHVKMRGVNDSDGDALNRYIDKKDFFIEPDSSFSGNIYDDWDGSFEFVVRLTGRFYTEKGYPYHYKEKEHHQPARVFHYRKFKIIKGGKKKVGK